MEEQISKTQWLIDFIAAREPYGTLNSEIRNAYYHTFNSTKYTGTLTYLINNGKITRDGNKVGYRRFHIGVGITDENYDSEPVKIFQKSTRQKILDLLQKGGELPLAIIAGTIRTSEDHTEVVLMKLVEEGIIDFKIHKYNKDYSQREYFYCE